MFVNVAIAVAPTEPIRRRRRQ